MAYREFNCVVCGRVAIDKGISEHAKYCGEKCRNKGRYLRLRKPRVVMACKYNEGVDCLKQKCSTCGWNPVVEKIRKEAYV